MKKFSELGITNELQGYTGDKIKIDRILNKEIAVLEYRIEDSKFNGKCLHMQVEVEGSKRVVFTGSVVLMEMIQKVGKADFPFKATIIKENERFEFS